MNKSDYLKLKEVLDEQISLLVEHARDNPEDAHILYELCGHLVECNHVMTARFFKWPPSEG